MSQLQVQHLDAFYGDFQALFDVSLDIEQGEAVAMIGANGAGKSTLMKAVAGQVSVSDDAIQFKGHALGRADAPTMVNHGLVMVPEGRRLFPSLTVEENLRIGNHSERRGYWDLQRVYELFPILEERRANPGTALSGGQQQMVAIGRGLMSNPDLILFDEISLGLAPTMIKDIYTVLPRIREEGTTVVVVEQDINQALAVSDRFYCFQEGRVSLTGRPGEIDRETIKNAYFGV